MTVIVTAVGVFYMFAAALVLRRARLEWFLDRAIERLSGKPEPDRYRIAFIIGSALLYGGAGLALLLRSRYAVWMLGAGLLTQAVYYGVLWLRLALGGQDGSQDTAQDDPGRWTKAWNAAMPSAAAFALVAYALRQGVLV